MLCSTKHPQQHQRSATKAAANSNNISSSYSCSYSCSDFGDCCSRQTRAAAAAKHEHVPEAIDVVFNRSGMAGTTVAVEIRSKYRSSTRAPIINSEDDDDHVTVERMATSNFTSSAGIEAGEGNVATLQDTGQCWKYSELEYKHMSLRTQPLSSLGRSDPPLQYASPCHALCMHELTAKQGCLTYTGTKIKQFRRGEPTVAGLYSQRGWAASTRSRAPS